MSGGTHDRPTAWVLVMAVCMVILTGVLHGPLWALAALIFFMAVILW